MIETRAAAAMLLPATPGEGPGGGPGERWSGHGFAAGTILATPSGPVAVDTLLAGHSVLDPLNGAIMVVRVDRRGFSPGSFRWNRETPAVRITAGSLGGGLPDADLLVGPSQPLVVNDLRVPATALLTGTTIRLQPRSAPLQIVRLWPEAPASGFGRQPVVLAAGQHCPLLPAPISLPPEGNALSRLRARLLSLAGQVQGELLGHLDRADHGAFIGWASDASHPASPVCLEISCGDTLLATVLADDLRPDLPDKEGRSRRCGFSWKPCGTLSRRLPHVVSVRRAGDNAGLPGSPTLLPALTVNPDLLSNALAVPALTASDFARSIRDALTAHLTASLR